MIGAIAGDIIGSVYERHNLRRTDFPLFDPWCRFTDDTVLTIAIADTILTGASYLDKLKEYYRYYPHAGYGGHFRKWAASDSMDPYYSMGNGSAMRVSPVGFAFNTLEEVLEQAKRSAEVTHNHPEGIKGAQAVASAVFLARTGKNKMEIKAHIERTFDYNLGEPLDEIREYYRFDETCPGSVPQAITAFLESNDYEDAIRKAISIGGDSDTIACMAGGIAQAFYGGVPQPIVEKVRTLLDRRLNRVVSEFMNQYGHNLVEMNTKGLRRKIKMKRPANRKENQEKAKKPGPSRATQKSSRNDKIDPRKIIQYGKIVYHLFWDSGAPGPGADYECVYKWRNWYAVSYSFGDLLGPYQSLSAAIRAAELNVVTEATVSIESSELKADEIARILRSKTDPPFTLKINNETWFLSKEGKLMKEIL